MLWKLLAGLPNAFSSAVRPLQKVLLGDLFHKWFHASAEQCYDVSWMSVWLLGGDLRLLARRKRTLIHRFTLCENVVTMFLSAV